MTLIVLPRVELQLEVVAWRQAVQDSVSLLLEAELAWQCPRRRCYHQQQHHLLTAVSAEAVGALPTQKIKWTCDIFHASLEKPTGGGDGLASPVDGAGPAGAGAFGLSAGGAGLGPGGGAGLPASEPVSEPSSLPLRSYKNTSGTVSENATEPLTSLGGAPGIRMDGVRARPPFVRGDDGGVGPLGLAGGEVAPAVEALAAGAAGGGGVAAAAAAGGGGRAAGGGGVPVPAPLAAALGGGPGGAAEGGLPVGGEGEGDAP
jgi:hypothetical protein